MNLVKGFTLIELMTSLVVLVIVLTVGVPSIINMVQTNRAAADTNRMLAALNLARSEAVRRQTQVSLCAGVAGNATCSGNNDWKFGWRAFTDNAGVAGTFNAPNDQWIKVWGAEQNTARPSFTLTASAPFVRFLQDGSLDGTNAITMTITPTTCPSGTPRVRNLTIAANGRVNSTPEDCP